MFDDRQQQQQEQQQAMDEAVENKTNELLLLWLGQFFHECG